MRMALIRHGETEWNRHGRLQGSTGAPLNRLGRQQASGAAERLLDQNWSWMVSSPAARARETAAIIAARLGMPLLVEEPGLRERAYGLAEGLTATEANEQWPDGAYPGLEPLPELAARGATSLQQLAASGRNGDGIVVGHGAFIRAAASLLCGIPMPRIPNGAILTLGIKNGVWSRDEDRELPHL